MSVRTAAVASEAAWKALEGAYDLQVHVAPDVIARRIDDLELAKEFLSHGMSGFVLKSHYFPTAERASVVTKAVPGIHAYGAIVLNHSIGGLNPVAVELAGRSGCKIVWMTVLDATGELLPAARACLELIRKYNMILATGHLGRREIVALIKAARDMKLQKILVTHAEFPSQNLSAAEQAELASMGALIEHCFTTMHTGKASWEGVFEAIRATGAERCVISTDLGQTTNPGIAEGFALFAETLFGAGFMAEDIRRMAVENPAMLLAN
jgi:hypothetical protein